MGLRSTHRGFSSAAFPLLALCASLFIQTLPAQQLTSDPEFAAVPFEKWLAEGEHTSIPWKTRIHPPILSFHQRLLSTFDVEVDGLELVKRGGKGRLVTLVQVRSASGRVFRTDGALELEKVESTARAQKMIFSTDLLIRPGDYSVAFAVYDSETLEHSVTQRPFHVDPLKDDPLPDAWQDLLLVEFLPKIDAPDGWYRPATRRRFHLPITPQHPVHIVVLANLSSAGSRRGSDAAFQLNMASLLPTLKMLSQIEVSGGTLDIAALDLSRRRTSFEQVLDQGPNQGTVQELDWPGLRDALTVAGSNVIDVPSLQGHKQSATFLVEELARRLSTSSLGPSSAPATTPATGPASAPAPGAPPRDQRVLFFLSAPEDFGTGGDLPPLPSPDSCSCRVYYFQFQVVHRLGAPHEPGIPVAPNLSRGQSPDEDLTENSRFLMVPDSLERILKPLHPRVFTIDAPRDFRKALAAVLGEISRM